MYDIMTRIKHVGFREDTKSDKRHDAFVQVS